MVVVAQRCGVLVPSQGTVLVAGAPHSVYPELSEHSHFPLLLKFSYLRVIIPLAPTVVLALYMVQRKDRAGAKLLIV